MGNDSKAYQLFLVVTGKDRKFYLNSFTMKIIIVN